MKRFWCLSILLSTLFMSVDGAADSVKLGHAHGDDSAATTALADPADRSPGSQSDLEDKHCERCCHGHSVTIAPRLTISPAPLPLARTGLHGRSAFIPTRALAPPTPPPNA